MSYARTLALTMLFAIFVMVLPVVAADQQVILALGGKFCEFYGGDVQTALMKVTGVKAVDLNSKKGHAVVTVDNTKAKPTQLTDAVNAVKGDGWHCKAEIAK